jgi:hypothetical protein
LLVDIDFFNLVKSLGFIFEPDHLQVTGIKMLGMHIFERLPKVHLGEEIRGSEVVQIIHPVIFYIL